MLRKCSFVFLSILTAYPGVILQSSKPRTVFDYYLLLPDKYFEADIEQRVKWMLDPRRGAVLDIRHRYIYAPGDGAQSSIHVCLFRKADGSYLVGVKSSHWEDIEYTNISFYIYQKGTLVDVTKVTLPVEGNEELKYEMPRYGTTIKVRDQKGRRLYDLFWVSDRFRLKRH